MDMETITYLNKVGAQCSHQGLWQRVEGGIVLMHTKASQTFIPYSRILMIEQTVSTHGITYHEVRNKQLTNLLRATKVHPDIAAEVLALLTEADSLVDDALHLATDFDPEA